MTARRASSTSPLVADGGPPPPRVDAGDVDAPPPRNGSAAGPAAAPGELVYTPELEGPAEAEAWWEERQVRALLVPTGIGANKLLGAGHPEAFKFTEDDLEAIAPGLTNYLNRYDVTRAAARVGDEAALFVAFGQYGLRSVRQRGQAMALARELAEDDNLARERELADDLTIGGQQ